MREELYLRYQQEEDEEIKNVLRRRIASVENLADVALPIIERLDALPESATWGDWIKALVALAEFTLRDPDRVVDLLEEFEPMGDIGPVGLSEVLTVLSPRLNSLRSDVYGIPLRKGVDSAESKRRGA